MPPSLKPIAAPQEIWKIAMEAALASEDAERPDGLTQQLAVAAKSAAAFCQDHGYDAAGQARMATLAVGEVARRLRGDVELRQSAAGFAAAQEAQRLGLTPSEAAEESALARRLAGVRSGEEARTVVQGSTMHFASAVESVQEAELEGVEADAAEVLGKDLSSLETRSMLIGAGAGMAALLILLPLCVGIFCCGACCGRSRTRKPHTSRASVDSGAESGEETPLMKNQKDASPTPPDPAPADRAAPRDTSTADGKAPSPLFHPSHGLHGLHPFGAHHPGTSLLAGGHGHQDFRPWPHATHPAHAAHAPHVGGRA
ncbi:unnamed protein product [Durusdinium trenchii]|uniref:Uncharacterized protein n=1 Tax=Durusdinium trenchii TaxID=1381693 RepID=A0ABP0QSV9_9DINO